MLVTRYPTEKPTDNITPPAILDHYRSLNQRSYRLMRIAEQHYSKAIRQACDYLKHPDGQRAAERFLDRASWNGTFVIERGFDPLSSLRIIQTVSDLDLEGVAQLLLDNANLWRDLVEADATLDLLRVGPLDPDGDTNYVIAVVPRDKFGTSKYSRYCPVTAA